MTALTLTSLSRSLGLSPRGRTVEGAAPAIVAAGLIANGASTAAPGRRSSTPAATAITASSAAPPGRT